MQKPKTTKIVAVYEGEVFRDVGSVEDVADRLGISEALIRAKITPSHIARNTAKREKYHAVLVGEEPKALVPQLLEIYTRKVEDAEKVLALGAVNERTEGYFAAVAKEAADLLKFLAEYQAAWRKWEND